MTISIPKPSARVFKTAIVCGSTVSETKNLLASIFFCSLVLFEKNIFIASAAAVPSSNNDAFAKGKPVSSAIMV